MIVVDNLTSSYLNAINFLKGKKYDSLFLDFPVSTEAAFRAISYGASWKEEIEALKDEGLIRDPEDSQMILAAQPLFEYLQYISVDVFCYRDTLYYDLLRKLAGNMFALTASSKIFGIKASRWLSLMEDWIFIEIERIDKDGNYVIENAGEENVVFGGEGLAEHLFNRGYDVETMIIDQSFKPLDLLKRIVTQALKEGKEVPIKVVDDLVKEHLSFVDLIIQSESYEDAYVLWKDRMPPK
ncbi:MAG: hypothetical protein LUQ38_00825 [Methanotrichaceae archaeon]|nr:hypothetical protein [Methanotrichaceae archaeon]